MPIHFEHTYSVLPQDFYQTIAPSLAGSPKLIEFNHDLASELGLDLQKTNAELARYFCGQQLFSQSKPLAAVYAGHQFGHFVPQLGDGRAILLGEVRTPKGHLVDIQLKGAGQTQYSRGGDGRSWLGPVLREYLVSEAMHALGIPTTRSLAAVRTGEMVIREEPLPGAVLTRVASSHLRIGTFEYFFARGEKENLKILTDYCIQRHYPHLANSEEKVLNLFRAVAKQQIELVSKWMSIGFIHGVMNTDNTSLSGETLDYGPCAFIDFFEHDKVFSSIDHRGRYAYGNQPNIILWNLSSLANCLTLVLDLPQEEALSIFTRELEALPKLFESSWLKAMAPKLGLFHPVNGDAGLIQSFLDDLENQKLDFTNTFRQLPDLLESEDAITINLKKRLDSQEESIDQAMALMNQVNPVVIPRNHQIEKAIQMAMQEDDSHFHLLHKTLSSPYQDGPSKDPFKKPPCPHEVVHQTFCGT